MTATHAVEDILVRLADEIGSQKLFTYRDQARQASRLVARHPSFIDQGFRSPDSLEASSIYKVFCVEPNSADWEWSVIRSALLSLLLFHCESRSAAERLAEGYKCWPRLPLLPVPESNVVAGIRLLSVFLSRHPRKNSDDLESAHALNIAADILVEQSSDPSGLEPSQINLEFIEKWQPKADSAGHRKTALDHINKLTVELATRLGASIRHEHTPRIRLLPTTHEIEDVRQVLAGMPKDQSVLLLSHALLGRYAYVMLKKNGSPTRVAVESAPDGAYLLIDAPTLGKQGSEYAFQNCLRVGKKLKLPLPRSLSSHMKQISSEPGYSYAKAAKALREKLQSGTMQGSSFRMKKLQRLLPAQLDDSYLDSTLHHLLGLANLTPRDSGIYYFSPSVISLQSQFIAAVTDLAQKFGRADLVDGGWTEIEVGDDCFGVSIRPDPDAICRLVQHLKSISSLPRGKPTTAARQRAFNAHSAYVTLLFLAGTGARPTGGVFPSRSHLDVVDGLALVSEKDSLLYRSTRLVRFSKRLQSEIGKLSERRRTLETAFKRTYDEQMLVFLIDDAGNPLLPTISNMKRHVAGFVDHWKWPDDVLRHHFRTRLWELGCPTDSIIKWMGHLGKSQTPDTIFASRLIEEAIGSADPFIESLLNELGFC